MTLTLGSLFNGISGWILAGQKYGVETLWESEVDKFCEAVTKHHFPDVVQLGDITKLDGAKLWPVDIICAGSPCQDLSVAGKQEGLKGERSGLFRDFVRIVREMKTASNGKYPVAAVWETVPGAFSSNTGNDIKAVLESFDELGYVLDLNVLDAQYMGVPQRRRRIFAVWLNVETLRQMKTLSSFSIITQCLVELLVSILIVKLNLSTKELERLGLNQKNLSEDGLLKKMKLFGIVEKKAFGKLLKDWGETLQRLRQEQENSDSPLDENEERIPGDMKELELTIKQSWNIDTLWREFLDALFKKGKSFTTLTATSEITDRTTYICAKLLESINAHMILLPKLWNYWSQMEQYVLTARKVCMNYVEQGQSSQTLFEPMEWLQYWDDYIDAVSQNRHLSLADIGADGFREIFSIGESVRGDSSESQCPRERFAPRIESSTGGASVVRMRAGCAGGGKGALVSRERSLTLAANTNDQVLFTGNCLTPWDCQAKRIYKQDGVFPCLQSTESNGEKPGSVYVPDKARSLTARNDGSPCADRGPDIVAAGFKAGQSMAGSLGYELEKAATLWANMSGTEPTVACYAIAGNIIGRENQNGGHHMGVDKDVSFTLNTVDRHAVCVGNGQLDQARLSDKVGALNCMHDQQAVMCTAGSFAGYQATEQSGSLKASGGDIGGGSESIVCQKSVRRLTPTECERLMGLEDGYTLIDDKTCSDTARYKALGNGMAQPVADYVIKRIVEVTT